MADLPVNVLDIGVVLVLLFSGILAWSRGFIHEVLSIGGWIGAIFATFYGVPLLRPYSRDLIPTEIGADLAAGAVVFLVSLVVLSLLARAISNGIRDSALNVLDRSLGFLFGLARGAVLVCLAFIALEWLMPTAEQPAWVRQARTLPLIEQGAAALKSLVPDDLAAHGSRAAEQARDKARQSMEAQQTLERMLSPQPAAPAAPGRTETPGAYGSQERKELDRLIRSNQ